MSDINLPQSNTNAAVEVVATFGDSVVGVKHVSNPRGGRISFATRALLVGGALGLAGALGGFAYAAKTAADDAAAKEQSIAQGRPDWYYRAHRSAGAADLAFGLAGSLGLAAVVWGLSRRKDERRDPRVRIGTDGAVDFAAPAAPSTCFDLIAPAPGGLGFELRTAGAMVVEGSAGPIALGTRARVRCGALTFHVNGVPAPARQPAPILAALDRRVATYFAGSVVAHAAILLMLRAIGPDAEQTTANADAAEQTLTLASITSSEQPKPDPATGEETAPGDSTNPPGGVASMQLPGTQGSPGEHSESPARVQVASISRDEAIERARHEGVDVAWSGEQLARINGRDDLDQGMDELNVDGTYDGSPDGYGSPDGSFGRGRHGVGPGGDIVFAGDYRTIPGGHPGGGDFNLGPTGGHCVTGHVCKGHDPVAPPVKIGPPTVSDDNIGPIVQRYIKRNRDRIGYCYEKALLGNPDLEGTVNATFVIAANGQVLDSQASGVNDEVSSCVASAIHSIEFPQLADQGTFQIKYPFIMHKPNS